MDIPDHFSSHLNIIGSRLLKIGYMDWICAALETDNCRFIRAISCHEVIEECGSVESGR